MKRKVIQQGPATLMISLPFKWVKENKIKKGDELELTENKNSILLELNDSEQKNTKKTTITINHNNFWQINQYIRNLYVSGYDEIIINVKDNTILETIQEATKKHLGYEIVEKRNKQCVIQSLILSNDLKLDSLIKRIYFQIQELFDKLLEDIKEKKFEKEKYFFMRNDVYKNIFYCERIIVKTNTFDDEKTKNMMIILDSLSVIAASLQYIYEERCKYPKKQLKLKTIYFIEQLKIQLSTFYDIQYAVKEYDVDKIDPQAKRSLQKEMVEFLINNSGIDNAIIHLLLEMIRNLMQALGPLLILNLKKE